MAQPSQAIMQLSGAQKWRTYQADVDKNVVLFACREFYWNYIIKRVYIGNILFNFVSFYIRENSFRH